jgi:hypothetical protein
MLMLAVLLMLAALLLQAHLADCLDWTWTTGRAWWRQQLQIGLRYVMHVTLHAWLQGAPLSAVTALVKVSHPTPMTSLAAVRDESELQAWGSRLAKQGVINPAAVDWVVEPKVDGLAVRVVYRCALMFAGLVCDDDEQLLVLRVDVDVEQFL